jgi:PAS domain S-box-containing protein
MNVAAKTHEQLVEEIAELRGRLLDAEETLRAIREGEVDALVVNERRGEKVYTLKSADRSYRLMIQEMRQGAASLTTDGMILFCNPSFARLLNAPPDTVTGSSVFTYVTPESRPLLEALLRQAKDGASSQGEVVAQRIGDEVRVPVLFTLNSVVLDGVFTLYAVATDLTDQKRMEELVANEDLARSILEQAVDAIVVCDETGRIVRASRAAHELCGRNPVLQPFESVFPPLSPAPALRGETLRGIEVRLDHPGDGRKLDLLLSAGPLRDDHQRIVGCVATLTDITERKRAEENLRLLADAGAMPTESLDLAATLQSSAFLAVSGFADWCVIDLVTEEGKIERVAAAHADPDRQELMEELRRFPPLWDEPYGAALVLRTGQAQRTPQVGPEHLDAVSKSPEHRQLLGALAPRSALQVPLTARGRSLGVWSFNSCSDRRYGDGDLALAEELARRAALAIDNARLYGAAQAANLAKDQFLATLSHELRTPLTPVMAVISSLERDARLPAPVQESLAMVRRNVELEARLIDDLLDLTRIARGKLELSRRPTDLHQVLEQAVETCCGQSLAAGRLRVVKDLAAPDPAVWADAPRLAQVFWNLLNNAIKFTPEGGTVTVRSWLEADPEPGEVVVQISDTGIGIPPGAMGHIFDAFEQGDLGTARRFGGLGLGLTISKAIVELHGGTLGAESEGTGQGAAFTVRLPVSQCCQETAEAGMAPEHRRTAKAASRGPLHILLVEDHTDTAEALAALLEGLGHRVTVAGTVAGALAAAEQAAGALDDTIDLVISDLGLPDGSGLDLMPELAGRYRLKGIALSGYGMEEDLRQSQQAGFSRHLTKPVTLDFLKDVIDQVRGPEGPGA